MFVRTLILVAGVLLAGTALPARAQTTFTVVNNSSVSYTVNMSTNPTLNLVRGQTYTFQVSAVGHPFWIKTAQVIGTGSAYSNGVTNNGTQSGTVTFVVPSNAPSTLFYICQFHAEMTGQINITGPTPTVPQSWGRLKARYR